MYSTHRRRHCGTGVTLAWNIKPCPHCPGVRHPTMIPSPPVIRNFACKTPVVYTIAYFKHFWVWRLSNKPYITKDIVTVTVAVKKPWSPGGWEVGTPTFRRAYGTSIIAQSGPAPSLFPQLAVHGQLDIRHMQNGLATVWPLWFHCVVNSGESRCIRWDESR